MSIVVLGTVALDDIKTPHGVRKNMLGGSAAHFAMAARMFTDVNLVSVVGEDFPERHMKFLRRKGVNTESILRTEGKTFHWTGEYKGDLNTAITLNTELGVLLGFKPVIAEVQRKIKYVFLANVDPGIQLYLLNRMYSPELVGLDSMNYWIKNEKNALLRVLKKVNIYFVNEHEARELSGESNLLKAAKELRKAGPSLVVIKKGEHGVLLYCDRFIFQLPAYPVDKIIDPTGAGDTFAGGFMGYLAKTKKINEGSLKTAAAYAVTISSFNVERFGLERTARLNLAQVNNRLAALRRIVTF